MEENVKTEVTEETAQVIAQDAPSFKAPERLPNAGLVLALGILSVPFCCCFPISLPLGIVAWVMGAKGVAKYNENPNAYTRSSYGNMNAGRIIGIVGVVLAVLYLVMAIINIIKAGGIDAYMEQFQAAMEQYN